MSGAAPWCTCRSPFVCSLRSILLLLCLPCARPVTPGPHPPMQCRHCGHLVCEACSTKKFPLLVSFAPLTLDPQRVCDGCFNSLSAFVDACKAPVAGVGLGRPPAPIVRSASTGAATPGGAVGRLLSSSSGAPAAGAGGGAGAGAGAGVSRAGGPPQSTQARAGGQVSELKVSQLAGGAGCFALLPPNVWLFRPLLSLALFLSRAPCSKPRLRWVSVARSCRTLVSAPAGAVSLGGHASRCGGRA